jgi:hypothetical protein
VSQVLGYKHFKDRVTLIQLKMSWASYLFLLSTSIPYWLSVQPRNGGLQLGVHQGGAGWCDIRVRTVCGSMTWQFCDYCSTSCYLVACFVFWFCSVGILTWVKHWICKCWTQPAPLLPPL